MAIEAEELVEAPPPERRGPDIVEQHDGRTFDHAEGWRNGGITVDQMRAKLLTLDQVRERLAETEPFGTQEMDPDHTRFRLGQDWWVGQEKRRGDEPVEAYITVRDREYQLTQDALLEAAAAVGLPRTYVVKTPGLLVQQHLDYWYSSPDQRGKLIVTGEQATGFAKGSIRPFSNLRLLERVVGAVQAKYGDGELYVDYKFQHSVRRTSMLLVVPAALRAIRPGDDWSSGLRIQNSLTGEDATALDGFLFRWWCTNGAITTRRASSKHSRRGQGGDEEIAYDWATRTARQVMDESDDDFAMVEALAAEPIEGEVGSTLAALFDNYKLPQVQRDAIRDEMMEVGDLTMYGLMQAVTAAANRRGLRHSVREQLMTVGGDLVRTGGRCAHCMQVMTPHRHE